MRKEREEILAKNRKIIEETSKLYAEWQAKQLEFVMPLVEAVQNETWFSKWFKVTERVITCDAWGFVENQEYYFEECDKFEKQSNGPQEKK